MLLAVALPMVFPPIVYIPAVPAVLIPIKVAPTAAPLPCTVMPPMVFPMGEGVWVPITTVPVLADKIPYTVGAVEETTLMLPVPLATPMVFAVVLPIFAVTAADGTMFIPVNGVALEVVGKLNPAIVLPCMLTVAEALLTASMRIALMTLAKAPFTVHVPLIGPEGSAEAVPPM